MIALITEISHLVGVSPLLMLSVCWTESRHTNVINPSDHGSASLGVCQIKYNTSKMIDPNLKPTDLLNPITNIYVASKYMKMQLKRYHGDERMAIAAYNAGKVKLNIKGLIVNRKYVKLVLGHKQKQPWRMNGKAR